MECPRIL